MAFLELNFTNLVIFFIEYIKKYPIHPMQPFFSQKKRTIANNRGVNPVRR